MVYYLQKNIGKKIILKKKSVVGRYTFNDDMKDKIKRALCWLDNLNHFYDDWLIYPKPTVTELYPNMNIKTGPWIKEKRDLPKR